MENSNLQERLVREHWIKPDEFLRAKDEQKKTGKSIFSCLIKLGYLNQPDVFRIFSESAGITFVNIADYSIKQEILNLISEEFYRENLIFPLFRIDQTLFVAMANPLDADLLNKLTNHTGLDVNPLLSSPCMIIEALDKHFGPQDKFFEMEDLIFKPRGLSNFPLHRESERISLIIPIEFKVDDERVALAVGSYIPAVTFDISESGLAIGIKTCIFLPSSVRLILRFSSFSSEGSIEAKGEVVYSRMRKKGEFFIGVKLLQPDPALISRLLEN